VKGCINGAPFSLTVVCMYPPRLSVVNNPYNNSIYTPERASRLTLCNLTIVCCVHENDFQTSPHQPLQSDATIHPVIRNKDYGPLPTGAMISSLTTASQFPSCSSWQSSGTVNFTIRPRQLPAVPLLFTLVPQPQQRKMAGGVHVQGARLGRWAS
jgi:hypothetical protein